MYEYKQSLKYQYDIIHYDYLYIMKHYIVNIINTLVLRNMYIE